MQATLTQKNNFCFSYLLAFFFCLPLCGTLELFFYLAVLQLTFIISSSLLYREQPSIIGHFKKHYRWAFYFFLSWLVSTHISLFILLFSDHLLMAKLAGLARQAFLYLQIGFFLCLCRHLWLNSQHGGMLLLAFLLGFLCITAIQGASLFFGPVADSREWVISPLLAANIRDIGNLAEAATIIACILALFANSRLKTAFFSGIFIICLSYVFWTGGRAAIIASIAVIFLSFGLFYLTQKSAKKLLLLPIVLLAALFLSEQSAVFDWNGVGRFALKAEQAAVEKTDLSNGRLGIWKMSFQAYKAKPLFGQGPYSFFFIEQRMAEKLIRDQPHNLFLQTLLEWGLIGSVLFFSLLLSIVWAQRRALLNAWQQGQSNMPIAALVILLFAMRSMTGGAFWNFQPVVTLLLMFTLLLINTHNAHDKYNH